MKFDDYTLVVTVPKNGKSADGELYVDDGESYDYEKGQYIHRKFSFDGATSLDLVGRCRGS